MRGAATTAIERTALAVFLCLPLLPAGPAYLGLDPALALDVALLLLVALAAASWRWNDPPAQAADAAARPPLRDTIGSAWMLVLATVLGAALVGLWAENDPASPVFLLHLTRLPELLWPVDRVWDPLYPLATALVLAHGALAYVAVRALCIHAADPARRARRLLQAWAGGFGVVSAFAVFQYVTRYRLHPYWVAVNPQLTRSHATLDDPNALGSYLVLGIFLCLGFAAAGARRRSVAFALATVGGLALLASASRAAICGLAVAALMYQALPTPPGEAATGWRSRARRGARWLLAAALLLVGVSLALRAMIDVPARPYQPTNVAAAVASIFDPRVPLPAVLEQRGTWWAAALRMWREAPLLGVGLGRFPRLLPAYGKGVTENLDAHNFFLQVLAEMGILGLAALLALLTAVFARLAALRRRQAAGGERLASAVLCGSVAFVATFATGHPLLLSSGQVLWAVLIAAAVVHAEASGHARSPRGGGTATGMAVGDPDRDAFPVALRAPRLVALCTLILAVYALAAVRVPGPPSDGTWGYSYGLYAPEAGESGAAFRWTGALALLELDAPAGADTLRVPVTVDPAQRDGGPTEVRMWLIRDRSLRAPLGPRDVFVRRVSQPASFEVALAVDAGHRVDGKVTLYIEVTPTFVPARHSTSDDRRELGLRLAAPRLTRPGGRQ